MAEYGFTLGCEEHGPEDLVRYARLGEEAGFSFASVTDHFHPWAQSQGQSPFVWSVIAAASQVTGTLRIGTGVTCPIMRVHPVVLAQAAATSACLLPGRFFFGVGSGEALNEHVVGQHWPPISVRLDMMEEAVSMVRELWTGRLVTRKGKYFTVEQARIYTLPEVPPPIIVSALGPRAAQVAARCGDGYWGTSADQTVLRSWRDAGGRGPCYGQVNICWSEDEARARRTARRVWPNAVLSGPLPRELRTPGLVEAATATATEDDVARTVICGPEPGPLEARVRAYVEAGYDHIYFHQIGPDQQGFFRFFEQELAGRLPR